MSTEYEPDADPLAGYDPGPVVEEPEPDEQITPIEAGAERSILAALLTTPKVFDDLCDVLVAADFGVPAHEAIYAAIVACDATGRPFDVITVADEMRRAGTLDVRGRGAYLRELAGSAASLEALDAHVEIVLDRSLRRRMVSAARTIGSSALNPAHDASSVLDIAEQQIFDLSNKQSEPSLAPMSVVMSKTQEMIDKVRTMKIVGKATGIHRLDEITGGLRGGQFVIIAARPSMGKSVLGLQIAEHIAETENMCVPFFSYEMSHEELGVRLVASRSGVPLDVLTRGHVPTDAGMDRVVAEAVAALAELPLHVDDRPPASVTALRSKIRAMARRQPLGAVVVDYIQLLEGDGSRRSNENRTQEVSFISRTLKQLAVELDVPIIAISQLSRQLESRPNKRPMMSDLRESGALEQDANLILGLYRDWAYDRTMDETHAELLVLKNRQGPLDEIALDFEGECARFRNTDRELVRGPAAAGFGRELPTTDLF